jgi:hypothetical protein
MDLQVVPTLDTLRQWLDDAGITFLNVIPARRCICLICRISTAFSMPKSI